jgi:hypothetical protein
MVNKCAVHGCNVNYKNGPKGTVFGFPSEKKYPDLRGRWIKFVNREDWLPTQHSGVCKKHFEEGACSFTKKRWRLNYALSPVPTIIGDGAPRSAAVANMVAPVSTPRPPPKRRLSDDQLAAFVEGDTITSLSSIVESMSPPGFSFRHRGDHVVFYKLEDDPRQVPIVTAAIKVSDSLHVELSFKGCPVPLPEWFRSHRCKLRPR